MINCLKGIHKGKTVAVVGASESASLFKPDKYDISIGVNGAAFLKCKFDYFMCSDSEAPKRSWFRIKCSLVRVIALFIAEMDPFLYSEPDRIRGLEYCSWKEQDDIVLPSPIPPHITYRLCEPSRQHFKLLKDRKIDKLMARATVSAQAVELAYLMGASSIHLFGCSMSQDTSGATGHYFYKCEREQIGEIKGRQIRLFNNLLSAINSLGTEIVLHGETNLVVK